MNHLTPEQEARAVRVRDEWIDLALGGAPIDEPMAIDGIQRIYRIAGLEPPADIRVLHSPHAARRLLGSAYDPSGWCGLGMCAGWASWRAYFLDEPGVLTGEVRTRLEDYLMHLRAGVWELHVFHEMAVAVARPRKMHKDDNGRLHNDSGPAVEWYDGVKMYYVHGVHVGRKEWLENPQDNWVENPQGLTAMAVLNERNAEVRRVMLARIGIDRFVTEIGASVVHTDTDASGMPRRLLRVEIPDDEPLVVVQVTCPSTGRVYINRVNPAVTTCLEAVASRWGLRAQDFHPVAEG